MTKLEEFTELRVMLHNQCKYKWKFALSYKIIQWDDNKEYVKERSNVHVFTDYCIWVNINELTLWKKLLNKGYSQSQLISYMIEFINGINKQNGFEKNYTIIFFNTKTNKLIGYEK